VVRTGKEKSKFEITVKFYPDEPEVEEINRQNPHLIFVS